MRSQRRLVSPKQSEPVFTDFTNKWSMDENSGTTLADSIGGIDLSYPVDLAASSVIGQVGNAVNFKVKNYNALSSPSNSLSYTENIDGINELVPFTLLFWINTASLSFNPIMNFGPSNYYEHLYISIASNLFRVIMRIRNNGTVVKTINFSTLLSSDNSWVLTGLTFEPYPSMLFKVFKNGIKINETSQAPAPQSVDLESVPFTAGGISLGGRSTYVYSGLQDEIRWLKGVALSEEKMLIIHNNEK